MLELCKTRTKKSSPYLFNFYVVLTGHDMVINAGRATTCSTITKKNTKNEGPSDNIGFT